ncbi:hypothetical protein CP985_03465 [Malaciobacter mytili LMG 24559]|uniref:Uncharacterized protein n=2 Tax=Malaciobacter mytili TaxID=603050 RepID=A0AAX2AKD5_9BACT|nr:hypothetical protein [Malaciobacter mytili]RXK16483.1 hypothetical protein CP985_03465 [Malaciobacter mytili LMG 24559]
MLKTMVLIVLSSVILFGKDIPIRKMIDFEVPVNKSVIIEFPFEINVKPSNFITKEKILDRKEQKIEVKDDTEVGEKSDYKIVKPDINGKIVINNSVDTKKNTESKPEAAKKLKKSSFKLSTSKNIIELSSKKEGRTEIIVWGYEYPIIINIKVVDKEIEDRYFKFINYEETKAEVKKFESNPHEKVLEKLLYGLYNNKYPSGFKTEVVNEEYKNDGLYFKLMNRVVGLGYIGEIWVIESTEGRANLYEEMFADKNIYLISLEADKLEEKGQSTRLFVIRAQ